MGLWIGESSHLASWSWAATKRCNPNTSVSSKLVWKYFELENCSNWYPEPHHLGPSALEAGNSFIVGERSVLKEGENGTELNRSH